MNKKNMILASLTLMAAMATTTIVGCQTTNGQHGLQAIEQMSDVDYSRWKLYISLGVKIGANRLLQEGTVTKADLNLAATALETVRDQTVVPGATSLIMPALEKAGLTNDEVKLLLLVVEQELLARGALTWIDPTTGVIALSPRTKDLLTVTADALRSATTVTESEQKTAKELQTKFNGKLMQ